MSIKKLFEGVEGISEETLGRVEQIIETKAEEKSQKAITEANDLHTQEVIDLKESHAQELADKDELMESAKEDAVESLVESLDEYLNVKATEWAEANAVGIDSKIKLEMANNVLTGLVSLVESNNMTVAEDSESLVESLEAEVSRLTEKADRLDAANLDYVAKEQTELKEGIVKTVCEGMADTQRDSVSELLEGVEFRDEEHFTMKVESYRRIVEKKADDKGDDTEKKDDKKDDGKKEDKGDKQVDENVNETAASVLAFLKS